MEERRFPKLETYYGTLAAMQARFDEEERPDRLKAESVEEYVTKRLAVNHNTVENIFKSDLKAMYRIYGIEGEVTE